MDINAVIGYYGTCFICGVFPKNALLTSAAVLVFDKQYDKRQGDGMKKFFAAFAAAVLFSSCDFWNAPVKSWFEEYTQNPRVTGADFAGKYETGSDGTVYASSSEDFQVIMNLQNPLNFVFTAANMTLFLPDELPAAGIDMSTVTIMQDSSDLSKIIVTYPQVFLRLAEQGKNITPRVNLRHPKVGIDFGTFEPAAVVCNSPPPFPFGAMLYKDNSDSKYVVCFNMPSQDMLKTNALHSDIVKIRINGTEFPITLNADGTFVAPAGLLQAASPAAVDSHFVKRGVSYPDFQKNGQPVFFKTNDVENSDKFDYRIEIVDSGSRAGKTLISSKSVQLKTPSAAYNSLTLSASSLNSLQAVDDDDSVTVRIMPPTQAVNGTLVDGAAVHYELFSGHSASGVLVKSGTISPPNGELEIAGGDFFLKLYAHKDEYVDSQALEYKITVRTQVYFVKGTGAVVLTGNAADSNSGSRLFPFATVQKALSAVPGVSGMPSPYKIYIDGETSETQKITVGGSGANKSVTIERLGGAAQAVIGRAAAFTTDSLIRLEENSSLTLKNITVDGKVVSAGGSGISTAGTLVLSGSTVQNCTAAAGQAGGILVEKGACTLDSSIIKDCQASGKKRGVYVKAYTGGGIQPVFTVKGASQVGSSTDTTAVCLGFAVDTGALVTAQDLASGAHVNLVPEDYVKQYGKALVLSTISTFPAAAIPYFSLTEKPTGYAAFRIQAGTAASGNENALLLRETVTIDGGADTNAWAYVKYYATHILSGDDIIIQGEVKAKSSGSVMINGESVQTDGEIHVGSDVLIRGDGAGAMLNALMQDRIFVFDGASSGELTLKNLTLKNGKVTAGHKGGAALVKQNKTLVLENCKIQECEAGKGGALYVEKGGECVLSGTRLSGNKATDAGASGGAVYAEAGSGSIAAGNVRVSGASVITKETDSGGQKRNDVCLENGALISVTGEVSGTGIIARITPSPYTPALAVVQGAAGFTLPSGYENRFAVTEDGATSWALEKSGNELKLKTAAFILDGTAHPADGWKLLKDYITSAPADSTVLIKGTIQATTASGNNGVIPITKNITIYGERSGTTITSFLDADKTQGGKPAHRIFTVSGAGTVLTLKDVVLKNGKASGTGMDDKKGGAILLKDGAHCVITDCGLHANEASEDGGALAVSKGTKCTITNTTIDSNIATGRGGGVFVENGAGGTTAGTCAVSGGSFTKNEAGGLGGGALYTAGKLEITSNCTIGGTAADGNKAGNTSSSVTSGGGGIYVFSGTCILDNVTVMGNIINGSSKGTGVRLHSTSAGSTVFTVKGTTKIGGSADTNAVYVSYTGPTQFVAITADNLQTGTYINIEPGSYPSQKNKELVKGEHASIYAAYFHLTGVPAGESWNLSPNAADNALRLRQQEVIDGTQLNAWKKLKDAVTNAETGDVILVKGEIKASDDASGNYGQIPVTSKKITIKKDGSGAAIIDANKVGLSSGKTSRIFELSGSGVELTIDGVDLKNGKAAGDGGGVLVDGGILTLQNGATITACEAGTNGGAIAVKNSGVVTANGAEVKLNKADGKGGGVYVEGSASRFKASGGKLQSNEAKQGGGAIYIEHGSVTLENNVELSANNAVGSNGGAVYVDKQGMLTINGADLKSNNATKPSSTIGHGGGIFVTGDAGSHGTVVMSAGTIESNIASINAPNFEGSGGGVCIDGQGVFEMSGGEIKENKAKNGGGVYIDAGAKFSIKGEARVTVNSLENDVYIKSGGAITMTGALTQSAAKPFPAARITPESYTAGTAVVKGGGYTLQSTDAAGKFSLTQQPVMQWELELQSGSLVLKKIGALVDGNTSSAWKKLKDAVAAASAGDTIIVKNTVRADNSSPHNSGEIPINTNLTIKGEGGAAILDANTDGSDAPSQKHRIFKVTSGKTLTLENLTLKGGKAGKFDASDPFASSGGAIRLNGGSASLRNVTISGCKAITNGGCTGQGGGVCAEDGGTLTLNNSTIKDCEATENGGAIYAAGGTINLTNCNIRGCKAINGGGIHLYKSSGGDATLTVSGGQIGGMGAGESNTASDTSGNGKGGGIFIEGGSCTVTLKDGAKITGNTANNGGGVYAENIKTFTLKNAAISSNIAMIGGGIYATGSSSVFTMENGTIIGNKAEYTVTAASNTPSGGGVYLRGGVTFTMKGGKITSSILFAPSTTTPVAKGGGVFIKDNGTKLILEDSAEISGNSLMCRTDTSKANFYGGGVYVEGGAEFTLKDSAVKNNKMTTYTAASSSAKGGGVYVKGTGSKLILEGTSEISGNEVKHGDGSPDIPTWGGGVCLESSATFTMKNGTVKNNKCIGTNTIRCVGGGVYAASYARFNFEGGTISGNSAGIGKGVYIQYFNGNAYMTMSGGAKVDSNNDVYFGSTGGNPAFITVTRALSNSPAATLTMENIAGYAEGREVVKGDGYTLTAEDIARFPITAQQTSPVQNWTTELGDNALKLKKERKTVTIKSTDANAWKKLKDEVEKTSGGAEKIIIEGTVQAKDGSKGEITVSREVEIEGNGTDAVLDANQKNRIFEVKSADAYLKLTNITLKNGKVTKNNQNGGAILFTDGIGVFSKCIILSCSSNNFGGAIALTNKAALEITDNSIIENCNAKYKGGGLYIIGEGDCTLKNSSIKNCHATNNDSFGGGAWLEDSKSKLVLNNSLIESCTSKTSGGGIYIATGGTCTFEMSGSAKVTVSTGTDKNKDGANEIFLQAGAIKVTETLTVGDGQAGRISVMSSKYQTSTQVLTGANLTVNCKKFTVTPKNSQNWYVDSSGKLTNTAP